VASHTRVHLVLLFVAVGVLCGCRTSSSYNADGVRQYQQGQYQSSLDSFQQAIATNPDNADAYYNLAATLHDWGRRSNDSNFLEQSESLYHRCLDLRPDHVDCHRALAVLLVDTRRKESAFTLLERWAARNPTLAAPRIELARLYEEHSDDDAARQYLTQALDVDSTSSRAWAALGRLREREGRLAQALTNYQHSYNLNRYHPGVTQRIAALQQRVARAPSPPLTPRGSQPRLSRNSSNWMPR
jgi:tetratricopeptide (TPR) repeat protein